jgi:hypothetical protein
LQSVGRTSLLPTIRRYPTMIRATAYTITVAKVIEGAQHTASGGLRLGRHLTLPSFPDFSSLFPSSAAASVNPSLVLRQGSHRRAAASLYQRVANAVSGVSRSNYEVLEQGDNADVSGMLLFVLFGGPFFTTHAGDEDEGL